MKASSSKIVFAILLLTLLTATACNKNYYSGSRKGSNCGCPSNPR